MTLILPACGVHIPTRSAECQFSIFSLLGGVRRVAHSFVFCTNEWGHDAASASLLDVRRERFMLMLGPIHFHATPTQSQSARLSGPPATRPKLNAHTQTTKLSKVGMMFAIHSTNSRIV